MKTLKAEPGVEIDAGETMYPSALKCFGAGWNANKFKAQTTYGYVLAGSVKLRPEGLGELELRAGCYYAVPGPWEIEVSKNGLVVHIQRVGFRGQFAVGAVEARGRLSYIDGCSDSMLVYPPRCGDPVLNHLYFPRGIVQTQHTHPSVRFGIVVKGNGHAWQKAGPSSKGWEEPLTEGSVFLLDEQELHSFRTDKTDSEMHVVAYHPDSDWGPTDHNHPMLKRTYIDHGTK